MSDLWEPRIDGEINGDEVIVGRGVVVEEGVLITGREGPARKVVLGDFCYIGRYTRIIAPEFSLGQYSKLHNFSIGYGEQSLQIGRNCWIGGNTVLDSMAGLDIDDNVGIGAHSQLWTHMQFGDIVEGSRFNSRKYMHVGKEAWFVGHCIVSPVRVGERSMALVGSVISKDMLADHTYAGVPARDVTDKLGAQFEHRSVDQKAAKLQELIEAFVSKNPQFKGQLKVIRSQEEIVSGVCCFDVSRRVYTKTNAEAEVRFLKAHVPLVKFTPDGDPAFVTPREPAASFE